MYALDSASGKLIWRFPSILSYPAIVDSEESDRFEERLEVMFVRDVPEKGKEEATEMGEYTIFSGQYANLSQYSVSEPTYSSRLTKYRK
jgi:hypothetical protein